MAELAELPDQVQLSEQELAESQRLLFALIHELGNVMAGVRLQAFLLTDDPNPRALATASIELDDLSAKACALLSLVRPLFSPPAPALGSPAAVLFGLRAALEDNMGRGVALHIEGTDDNADALALPEIAVDGELVRCLLLPLLLYGAEVASPGGTVKVEAAVAGQESEIAFAVEDDGSKEESLEGWRDQASRGRPLACQVADRILSRLGGRLEVVVAAGRTRIELRIPQLPPATC